MRRVALCEHDSSAMDAIPGSTVDPQVRQSLLERFHTRIGDLGVLDVALPELCEPPKMPQPGVGDLSGSELERYQIAEPLQIREPDVRDVRAAEIQVDKAR